MNQTFFILLFTLFYSCQSKPSDNTMAKIEDYSSCKKCDKKIIETSDKDWDKLSDAQIEQFLCSFDNKCQLNDKYKNSGATYQEVAFELLVLRLDTHLDTCVRLFDTNKNIVKT